VPGKGAFKRCVAKVTAQGSADDPRAVCATSGRRKYGAKRFAEMAAAGRRAAARRKNPVDAAIEAYEQFHGEEPSEILEFESVHHFPDTTSAIGDLKKLVIRLPKGRVSGNQYVELKGFGKAWLTEHPTMKQLYVEGGDQGLDLKVFGLSAKDPHETEYLGDLVTCEYFTRKVHLGKDGGTANYHHRFGKHELLLGDKKSELIKVGYHVPDEQLLFVGGGYTIPSEGIDG
jgi:hypothetical protein